MEELNELLFECLRENGYKPKNTVEYSIKLKKKLIKEGKEIYFDKENDKFIIKTIEVKQ